VCERRKNSRQTRSICRQQFANVFADHFCAVHTRQLEFAKTSLPTLVCRVKSALDASRRFKIPPVWRAFSWRIRVWTNDKCLATKHAYVEVSVHTVKTCLIKRRWNNWYKPLSKRGTHARIRHVWYTAVQTIKRSPIKHEYKRNVLSCCLNVWWPSNFIKHDQTLSNTIKQHQTRVVYHLPKNSENFGWDVNVKTVLVCPNGNFPK